MDNQEEKSLLGDFDYGLINIENERINLKEAQIESCWNEEIFDLVREIYPVVGKINLDLYQENKEKIDLEFENPEIGRRDEIPYFEYPYYNNDDIVNGKYYPLDLLTRIMKHNDIVISLRKYLYSEIEFNQNITNDKIDTSRKLFVKLGIEIIRAINSKEVISEDREIEKCITNIYLSNEYDSYKPNNLLRYIEYVMIGFRDSKSLKKRTIIAGNIIWAIHKSGLDKNTDRLWHIYLLYVYHLYLFNEPIKIDDLFFAVINEYKSWVKETYEKIDHVLIKTQIDNSKNMVMMYLTNKMSAGSFVKHGVIKGLYEALNNESLVIPYLRKMVTDKDVVKKKTRCFAAMYDRNKKEKYAAISGTFDNEKYVDYSTEKKKEKENVYPVLVRILDKMLAGQYIIIDRDEKVKYYFNIRKKSHDEITSQDYINSVLPLDKSPGKRMFSCCERKLSTKFELGGEYDIYTKYSPCPLCKRMIDIEERHNRHFINVWYWQNYKDKTNWNKFDNSARYVEPYMRYIHKMW